MVKLAIDGGTPVVRKGMVKSWPVLDATDRAAVLRVQLKKLTKIVKAMHGSSGDTGIATRQFIAELFELREVLVGEAWLNTAKKGQTVTTARVWGKHCALLNIDPQANTRNGVTFGFTAQFGGRVAGSERDPNIGMRGGERVRAGESLDEVISASDLGYFIQNAVA